MNVTRDLQRLSEALAPSGYERNAAEIAAEMLREFTSDVRIDRLGNVLGRVACGKPNAKTVLWDAHLDEIGIMVTGHEDGYLTFQSIGGIDPRVLLAQELLLLTEPPRYGVVACLPPHVQSAEEYNKAIPLDKLYLDIGLSAEEAKNAVPVGTVGCFMPKFQPLGEKLLSGKALDDRVGFVTLMRALELLRGQDVPVDIVIVGAAQEETGCYGATTAAFGTAPDVAFAVDVTYGGSPDSPKERTFPLGGGACIGFGPVMNRQLSKTLAELAVELAIPFDREVMSGQTGTNGDAYQIAREGIRTAVLSIPLRYMHTPVETVHLDDIEATAKLLAGWILSDKGGRAL